jgi:Na+-driven multidrug efflux pump
MTLGGQIEAITWNTSQGFSSALSAFISQNYAAGKQGRVLQAYKATLWITSVLGSLCTFLFIFYGQEVFSLFVPEEKAILAGGVFLFIDGYSQLFMMLEITTQGLFYGTGRTLPPAIISITFNCLRIPLAIILTNLGMGVEGIWWAISCTSIAKGLFAYLWFAIIKKRVLNIPSIVIQ